jgi:acetyl-CoA carboxylase carboxyltransferase component
VSNREALQRYHENRARMLAGGGEKRIEAQHEKGKLTARERLDLLLDKGSFVEQQPYITVRSRPWL